MASASLLSRRGTWRQLGRDLRSEVIDSKGGAASTREVLCSLVERFIKERRRAGTRSVVSIFDEPSRDGTGPIGLLVWRNRKFSQGRRASNDGEAWMIGLKVGGRGGHGSLTTVLVDGRRLKGAGSNQA